MAGAIAVALCLNVSMAVGAPTSANAPHNASPPALGRLCGVVQPCWRNTTTADGRAYSQLKAVSCPAAGWCMAVGEYVTPTSYRTLAEAWNGRQWAVTATDSLAGAELSGVSCTSTTACIAVGSYRHGRYGVRPLAERWDGSGWSLITAVAVLEASGLRSVSCVSQTSCIAVGSHDTYTRQTLGERWDGRRWTRLATPNPDFNGSELDSVACAAADSCLAVGRFSNGSGMLNNRIASEAMSGGKWTVQRFGTWFPPLDAVSCVSPTSCLAVGSNGGEGMYAYSWDGRRWTDSSPAPSRLGNDIHAFDSVACNAPSECMAVGVRENGSGVATLAEQLVGTTWTTLATDDPTPYATFTSVSCFNADNCMAVGFSNDSPQAPYRTLAEHYSALVDVSGLPSRR